jgi:hypothetical protein
MSIPAGDNYLSKPVVLVYLTALLKSKSRLASLRGLQSFSPTDPEGILSNFIVVHAINIPTFWLNIFSFNKCLIKCLLYILFVEMPFINDIRDEEMSLENGGWLEGQAR